MNHIVFDHDGTLVDTSLTKSAQPRLYTGIYQLLTELKQLNVKIYLWTARGRASTVQILKSLEIIGFFEDISTATDCTPKPSCDGLALMLNEIPKESIIMIGDSMGDIHGAKDYGIKSMGVSWASEDPRHTKMLKDNGASVVCESVNECFEYLMTRIKG